MRVTIGKDGLRKTWQNDFPEITKCVHCGGESRIGFVAHEGMSGDDRDFGSAVCRLHTNDGKRKFLAP